MSTSSVHLRDLPSHKPAVFDGLPRLPPLEDVENRSVLKACIDARVALAELNMTARMVSNPAILTNTLPMLEALASSQLDDVGTTADRLFRLRGDGGRSGDAATSQTLRYQTALMHGFDSLRERPLTAVTAVDVCRTICGFEPDIRTLPDTFPRRPAGAMAHTSGGEFVGDLLTSWQKSLHDEIGTDPLIRMAIGHAHFEAIQPFSDGNGRTGRILSQLYLAEQRLLEWPVLVLSRALIANREEYCRQLNHVTAYGVWEPWILYVVKSVNEAARWSTAKILAIRSLLLDTTRHVQRRAPALYCRELIELVFAKPCCRIADVVHAGVAKRQTASEYLSALAGIGVLNKVTAGRERLFIHARLMALLESEQHIAIGYEA